MPGGPLVQMLKYGEPWRGPLAGVQLPLRTMPGKLKLGVRKALLEVSRGGWSKSADGRVGLMLEALVIETELIWPVTGVHGKPVWALMMALTCQPPTILPIQSVRVR